MAKTELRLFLSPETRRLLVAYTADHERFTSTSQSADHLLLRALTQDLGDVLGEMVTPTPRVAIRAELIDVLQRCFPNAALCAVPEEGPGEPGGQHPVPIRWDGAERRRRQLSPPDEVAK